MTVEIGIAATYLVVGNHLTPRVGDTVEHLEIVVCASRATMKQQQGRFFRFLTHDAIVGLIAHKRHVAFSNYFYLFHIVQFACKLINY